MADNSAPHRTSITRSVIVKGAILCLLPAALWATAGCLSGGSAAQRPGLPHVGALSSKLPARLASFSPQSNDRSAAPDEDQQPPASDPSPEQTKYVSRPLIDNILFGPRRSADHGNWQPPANTEDVRFVSADGTRLHGWLTRVPHPRHVILFTHGNGGNVAYCGGILQVLSERFQATCLAFDYRGYGRSQGKPTLEGVVADASAARKFLARQAGIPPEQVILWGHSMGGAIAIQLTRESKPRALILDSTFSSLRDEAAHVSPNLAWMVSSKLWNSTDVISRYTGPLFIMHGDADRVIPWTQGRTLYEAANKPKEFLKLPGGQHNTSLRHPDARQPLTEFLDRLVRSQ